jgi:hypothetical protein
MNFNKLIAAVAAGALALSVMAFPTSAAGELSINIVGKDASTWADTTQAFTVNGDGEYTATFDVSAAGTSGWGYVNLSSADAAPDYANTTLTLTSFKVNDVEMPLNAANVTSDFAPDGGVVNVTIFNVFNKNFDKIDVAACTKASVVDAQVYDFLDDAGAPIVVDTFTIGFTLAEKPAETEAAPAETEAAAVEAAPAEDAAAVDAAAPAEEPEAVEEAAPAVEEAAPEATEAAPAETEAAVAEVAVTDAPATGNVPVIVVGSVMALALAGAVISRKRK